MFSNASMAISTNHHATPNSPPGVISTGFSNRCTHQTTAAPYCSNHKRADARAKKRIPDPGSTNKTPCGHEAEEAEPELPGEEALLYRRCAARLNYLSLDRPDCAFAAKELCRRMSCPTAEDMQALCRTVRYLAGCPRLTYFYEWQAEGQLAVCTDTDYAGCKVTRRSTSGGCVLLGKHMVRHWASTQRSVTLSSGEAELNGIVKGVCEGMGMRSLAADFGINLQVKVYADASAAIGICRRTGVGRVRHLAVGQLWVQDVVRSGEVALFKIIGTENPADISTNPQPAAMIARHLATMNMQAIKGRPVCAPSIAILQDGRGMVASACENSGAQ